MDTHEKDLANLRTAKMVDDAHPRRDRPDCVRLLRWLHEGVVRCAL